MDFNRYVTEVQKYCESLKLRHDNLDCRTCPLHVSSKLIICARKYIVLCQTNGGFHEYTNQSRLQLAGLPVLSPLRKHIYSSYDACHEKIDLFMVNNIGNF